ncbi:2-hydroxyacid dehydrogenase [Leucobacter chinensis]|uniref:2-hydroxyacid dehydrogenase n=1 Tax=Leucobacter chinensis TaxID=2851010 RepID=UPI001C225E0A|nr:2-hydroxyacid dehydrogenase [Leucobacter chinensis]
MNTTIVVSVPDERLLASLEDAEGVECLLWDMSGEAPRNDIDLVVPPYWDGVRPLARLEGMNVQLVQWQSIGFDGVANALPAGMRLANATSVHETATAELAVGITIAAQRGFAEAVHNQTKGLWHNETRRGLADKRVLLLGYGGVSKAIEARLLPFEVDITRVASRARTEQLPGGETVSVHGIDELDALLPEADIVMIGLPLSDATRGLFGRERLALMRDDALLVNVGRGPIVVTDDLVAELQTGRIRAALDVVDPEPLPEGHPLWACENAFITPHNGGDSQAMHPRIVRLIKRQVEHLRAGETPENIVLS